MSYLHRFYVPNSIIFITAVTHQRQNLLAGENIDLFWSVLKNVQEIKPFNLIAYCILPDHFHWLMKMPENNPKFSQVIHSVKWNFTYEYKKNHGINETIQIWQPRFWDHIIRDERDFENHMHYIHFNPVKHGYVEYPEQWEASSFRFWQKKGVYPENWLCESQQSEGGQFGE
jgi:putative transposase